jgi:hypothetical protein
MTPRNTSTGAVLEAMILPALARGGYAAVTGARVLSPTVGVSAQLRRGPVRRYLTLTYLRKLWAATSAE